MIDLAGDPGATQNVDAVYIVSSLPADSDAATTSYVIVEYDAVGRNRMNTADVDH